MAGSKSAYLEAKVLDYVLSVASFTPAGTLYVALSTAGFSVTATGASMNEVSTSGTAYARQSITNNATNFPAASGSGPSAKSNANAISFPTASSSWGTIYAVYLVDASSNGNIYYGADLSATATVNTGSSFTIPSGQFVFAET